MKTAVLIPCYNEERTISEVVTEFRAELPDARIYVYDNNSQDRTAYLAAAAGAIVVREPRQGKGNVVRMMFREIDADVYLLVDGDHTYPVSAARALMDPIVQGEADMVVGDRLSNKAYKLANDRRFHSFGNGLVRFLINALYGSTLSDFMSGYRALSRCFVKTMPITSKGFEVETEMSMHALDKRLLVKEVPIEYGKRPPGSASKLNTVSDGLRVIRTIVLLFKEYKPMAFFGSVFVGLFAAGCAIGFPVIHEFASTGQVLRLPSAVLAVGLVLSSMLSLVCGLILDTIAKNGKKEYEMRILAHYTARRSQTTRARAKKRQRELVP